MSSAVADIADQLLNSVDNLSIQSHQEEMQNTEEEMQNTEEEMQNTEEEIQNTEEVGEASCENHHGICAICLNKIPLQETALVKGCEHAYCVTCILRWAAYKEKTTCPQCKHPFESLNVHKSLDGSLHDYMYEESVCLLLRATWFNPLIVEHPQDPDDEAFDYDLYENQYNDDELNEMYMSRSPNLRIGNRRWGDNGFVRAGRQEARPAMSRKDSDAGPSRERKKKEIAKENPTLKDSVGRRAKRTLKREAADRVAAAKHEQHLVRLGLN